MRVKYLSSVYIETEFSSVFYLLTIQTTNYNIALPVTKLLPFYLMVRKCFKQTVGLSKFAYGRSPSFGLQCHIQ